MLPRRLRMAGADLSGAPFLPCASLALQHLFWLRIGWHNHEKQNFAANQDAGQETGRIGPTSVALPVVNTWTGQSVSDPKQTSSSPMA